MRHSALAKNIETIIEKIIERGCRKRPLFFYPSLLPLSFTPPRPHTRSPSSPGSGPGNQRLDPRRSGCYPALMKIASWNVNSIKARLDHVRDWLDRNQPDVLMLQELKGLEFPADAFTAHGYESVFVSQKSYNGVAMLSRRPLTVIARALPGDAADEQARYLEAELDGIRLINIYLPNGNPLGTEKFTYKLDWMQRLRLRLAALRAEGVPVAVGGDFNVIPEDQDCHDPRAWTHDALFQPESRAAFRALLALGFYDAFRALHDGGGHYTFWDYQAGAWPANKGIRIDHFLLSPGLTDRLTACTIDTAPRGLERASDHTPIIVAWRDENAPL